MSNTTLLQRTHPRRTRVEAPLARNHTTSPVRNHHELLGPSFRVWDKDSSSEGRSHYESLDPSYDVQNVEFFKKGKVFSVLFTESVGFVSNGCRNRLSPLKYDDYVHPQIRRFIVVRSRKRWVTVPSQDPTGLDEHKTIIQQSRQHTTDTDTHVPESQNLGESISSYPRLRSCFVPGKLSARRNRTSQSFPIEKSAASGCVPILHASDKAQTIGRKALTAWKDGAGSNKSWRRCLRTTTSELKVLVRLRDGNQCFFISPMYLPLAFVRHRTQDGNAHRNEKFRLLARCHKAVKQGQSSQQQIDDVSSTKNLHLLLDDKPLHEISKETRARDHHELDDTGLSMAYMRLAWSQEGTLTGQLDRFLVKGLVLQSCWRILSFLRNDSLADIYAVVDIHDRYATSAELELHHFLAEYRGNLAIYAKRKQKRMYNSGNCLARFWDGDRRMLVLRVPRLETPFRIDPKDFPALTGSASRPALQSRCTCPFSNIPTYAAVLRTSRGDSWLPPLHQRLKEEKARRAEEIIETAREKKSKKQRNERIRKRLGERQGRAPRDEEICVLSDANE